MCVLIEDKYSVVREVVTEISGPIGMGLSEEEETGVDRCLVVVVANVGLMTLARKTVQLVDFHYET